MNAGIVALVAAASSTATLAFEGTPVGEVVAVDGWVDRGGVIAATVKFGPFARKVNADSVLWSVAGGVPESIVFDSGTPGFPFVLPAGVAVDFELTFGG